MRRAAQLDDGFVAGTLALVDQPRANPPDQRIEPEQRLDKHMDERGQVVAPPNVAHLVGHDRLDVRVIQMASDFNRP